MVAAFIERSKQVNHIINAIVHDRFEKAIEEAKAVDKLIQSGSISTSDLKRKKPLLGVPYTSKEGTACKGSQRLVHDLIESYCNTNGYIILSRYELDFWHGMS